MSTVTVNGEERALDAPTTMAALLRELGFGDRPVVVEHNGKALLPREYDGVTLADGDRIELVQVVAGG